MLDFPWNLKLQNKLTWFYLVVKLPSLIIFSVRHKNLKNQRKNHLNQLRGTCKVSLVFNPSSIINQRNSCYGTKPYILGTDTILQLVHSLQGMTTMVKQQTISSFPIKFCEKWLFVCSHFGKLQVRKVYFIKENFNNVNLKSTVDSRGSFDFLRLY